MAAFLSQIFYSCNKFDDVNKIKSLEHLMLANDVYDKYFGGIKKVADVKPARLKYKEARAKSRLTTLGFILALYRHLDVKSALVSGAYLEVKEDYETKKPELQACAGSVASELRRAGIPTDISANIWPPKELIKAAGFEVKETGRDLKFQ